MEPYSKKCNLNAIKNGLNYLSIYTLIALRCKRNS